MKKFNKVFIAIVAASASFSTFASDESFNASIQLLEPITITESQSLSFEPTLSKQAVNVVTAPSDTRAAVFSAQGTANESISASVVETSIVMSKDGTGINANETITVDSFKYGGNLASDGTGSFDSSGSLTNMRVGATAHVQSDDVSGDYIGTATLRVTYM